MSVFGNLCTIHFRGPSPAARSACARRPQDSSQSRDAASAVGLARECVTEPTSRYHSAQQSDKPVGGAPFKMVTPNSVSHGVRDLLLAVHPHTAKTNSRSANPERSATPSIRWCESVMKVFLRKTLYFTRFQARALTVFFVGKKFPPSAQRKTPGFSSTNERTEFAAV
jgi:hypothetical protein